MLLPDALVEDITRHYIRKNKSIPFSLNTVHKEFKEKNVFNEMIAAKQGKLNSNYNKQIYYIYLSLVRQYQFNKKIELDGVSFY